MMTARIDTGAFARVGILAQDVEEFDRVAAGRAEQEEVEEHADHVELRDAPERQVDVLHAQQHPPAARGATGGASPAMSTAASSQVVVAARRSAPMPVNLPRLAEDTQYSAKTVTATWRVVSRIFFMRAEAKRGT